MCFLFICLSTVEGFNTFPNVFGRTFLADFAVETPNGHVMVILQRQKAFCSNKPEHKLGTTNLRERVLLVHGFKVSSMQSHHCVPHNAMCTW